MDEEKGKTMTTLALLKAQADQEEGLQEARYRRIRATTVLAAASKYVKDLNDPKLNKVLVELRAQNFDVERLSDRQIENLYAQFSKEMGEAVAAEFTFSPKFGNIKDHGRCDAHCDLCGKGDSRDDGANQDKLRYTFRLVNTAGGSDVWVGSSCILHHGLHVDGARTVEEAERILQKSLRQHIAQWKIEAWRTANPDHFDIPEQWQAFRGIRFWDLRDCYIGCGQRDLADQVYGMAGLPPAGDLHAQWKSIWRPLRTATRFYQRKGFLSPAKAKTWEEAKKMLETMGWFQPILKEALTCVSLGGYKVVNPEADSPEANRALALSKAEKLLKERAERMKPVVQPKQVRKPRRIR